MSCHWPWWRLSTILSRLQTTTQVTIDKTQSAFSIRQPSSSLVGEADVNGTSDDGELLPDLEGTVISEAVSKAEVELALLVMMRMP
jgi:hypothetical protein